MLCKERNDYLVQLFALAGAVAPEVLLVVVLAPIDSDAADTEEAPQIVQAGDALSALHYHESVDHLVAGLVAAPAHAVWLSRETD